jgi:hypothetical protein
MIYERFTQDSSATLDEFTIKVVPYTERNLEINHFCIVQCYLYYLFHLLILHVYQLKSNTN